MTTNSSAGPSPAGSPRSKRFSRRNLTLIIVAFALLTPGIVSIFTDRLPESKKPSSSGVDWSAATENIRADLARLNDGVARDEQQLLEAFQKRLSDAERLNRGDAAGGVEKPPHPPFTSREYKKAGVPWFDYYRDDLSARPGSKALKKVKSVLALGKQKGEKPLPENDSVETDLVVQYGNARRPGEVREWVGQ